MVGRLFLLFKIQKEIGKHILSLSAMGAPQQNGQRSYKRDIATTTRHMLENLEIHQIFLKEIL